MQNYIPGVLASLIAAFIVWIIKKIIIFIFERSDFNGYWANTVYDDENTIIKNDIFAIKYNKKTRWIEGKFIEVMPLRKCTISPNDFLQKWQISGILIGKDLACVIWSSQNLIGLNCCYLRLMENKGYKYEGICLKNSNDKVKAYRMELTKIERYKVSLKTKIINFITQKYNHNN